MYTSLKFVTFRPVQSFFSWLNWVVFEDRLYIELMDDTLKTVLGQRIIIGINWEQGGKKLRKY